MERVWQIAAFDEALVRDLCRSVRVSPLVAQVLVSRGCETASDVEQFLSKRLNDLHDPERLPGVPQAADRVVAAMQSGRRITIYGDYDVDGVTATSLLWYCLKLAGAHVDYYIPSRLDEGYGLNRDAVRKLAEEDPQRLLLTVDCGIASLSEAELATELGLELIITDHHHFEGALPAAAVVVHPRLPGGDYPFGDLCGVGVAFKLAWAICARLGDGKKASPRMRDFLLQAVGFAAIGTIADVVPLLGENRVLVHYGLSSLKERAPTGLKALLMSAGLMDKPVLQAEDVAFAIGPRINAAGRMGQARLAVELFTTDQPDRAAQLAEYLEGLNKNRQSLERKMLKQAKELVEAHPQWETDPGLVLSHPEWHAGVIGIVANRVAEHFQRPAILIAPDGPGGLSQGSGRSFGGIDLYQAIAESAACLHGFGGHQAAAGVKLLPEQLDSFRAAFIAALQSRPGESVAPVWEIDAEVRLADVTHRAVTELEHLGPFGAGHRRPVFVASHVELAGVPRKMGEGERHLSLTVRQYGESMRGVAFGKADWADELAQLNGPFSICFQPVLNRFRGYEHVEFQLLAWRPSTEQSSAAPASAAAVSSPGKAVAVPRVK
jgi:single-stranded-DNA-specific exonuclease